MEIDKGYEIARFIGEYGDNKLKDRVYALFPFLVIIIMIVPLILILITSQNVDQEKVATLFVLSSPIILFFGGFSYFIFEMRITPQRSPITLYSNGIEHRIGHIDRMRHRPDFIPKSTIRDVEIVENIYVNTNGREFSFTTVIIRTNDDHTRCIPPRRTDKMAGFGEAVQRIGVKLILSGNAAHASDIPVSKPLENAQICDEKSIVSTDLCDRGIVIAEYPGAWSNRQKPPSRFLYGLYGFAPFIMVIIMTVIRSGPEGVLDPFWLALICFAFFMGVLLLMLFDNIIIDRTSPIILRSNGIERKVGMLDRMAGRSDFIHTSSIRTIEVIEWTSVNDKGDKTNSTTIKINLTNGKVRMFIDRPTEGIAAFRETVSQKLSIPIV